MHDLRTIDLFSGAGGLALGFESSSLGFMPVLAVEHDSAAARTFKTNFGCDVYDGPIELVEQFPDAEIIIGGPPCQGFSPLGRDRDDESRAELNQLWREYLRAVRQVQPLAFVIENVPEFLKSAQFKTLLETLATDEDFSEYRYAYGVLNAADYGVPQRRRRGIFVASRVSEPSWPPPPTHGPESSSGADYVTVRDAIGDLDPYPPDGPMQWRRNPHKKSMMRYRAVPKGGNRFDLAKNAPELLPACWANKPTGTTDVFGRLWWDRPALTIRTEFFKPEKGRFLHPEAHRPINHREAARIQTFPDTFEFEGSKIEIARQIGNAVPPRLAEQIAKFVHELVNKP